MELYHIRLNAHNKKGWEEVPKPNSTNLCWVTLALNPT